MNKELMKLQEQIRKKLFRSIKAKELFDIFMEYVEEERKLIYAQWQITPPEEWYKLKAKLDVLQELCQTLENDSEKSYIYKNDLEEIENLKGE